MNSIFTAAALLGLSALAQADSNVASGAAIVINSCSYPIYVKSVPAAGEGYDEIDVGALQPGKSWSQNYVGLTGHHDGWSIKLAKDKAFVNLLQFEYTYQPTIAPETVWLDLSSVDGTANPWLFEGWTINSSQDCGNTIKQGANYLYSTDDAAGMQPSCPSTTDFTVDLCAFPAVKPDPCPTGWESHYASLVDNVLGGVGSAVGSVVAPVTSALGSILSEVVHPSSTAAPATTSTPAPAPATTSTPAPAPAPTSTWSTHAAPTFSPPAAQASHAGFGGLLVGQHDVDAGSAPATTLSTSVVSSSAPIYKTYGQTVTEIEVAWVTSFVTVDVPAPTEEIHKRHMHHAAHHHA